MSSSFQTCFSRLIVLLVLVSTLALLGCRSIATTVGRDLRLNLGVEPATIDPALATDPGSQQVARMLFLSLVDLDPATGTPQHSLATSWAVSSDGLIWEFKLRPDAVWVQYIPATEKTVRKRPVTAEDVVYSVRRIFDPRSGSGFAATFSSLLRGADQLRQADPSQTDEPVFQQLFANLGVRAVDDTTVQFILTHPESDFPSIVGTWLVRTQPRESIESGGSVWTEPGTIWTDGPYVLEQWRHGFEIILRKNTEWYGASSVHIERIRLTMIPDTATALEEYAQGNLDSLDPYDGLSSEDVDKLKEDPVLGKQLHFVPTSCIHYYGFNTTKAPFDDPLVRKAFAAAVDRDTLVSSVVKLGDPARWFARPGMIGAPDASDTIGIPFSASQAREYLKEAGYDKKRLPAITLVANEDETQKLIAETIVQMWKNNLGVEVGTKYESWKDYQAILRDDPPQIFRLGWCAIHPDASDYTAAVFHSGSSENHTRWSNPAFDQAVDTAARQTDLLQRRSLYRSADKLLVEDDTVIIPLWWSTRATLTRPEIRRTYAITEGYDRFETWSFQ